MPIYNKPMLHHWSKSNMTWLRFGSLLMYYVATVGMCECSVRVNGQGCCVGVDASKLHKWLYFAIWNSWQNSLKHQWWVLSVWLWHICDCKVHPTKPLQHEHCTQWKKGRKMNGDGTKRTTGDLEKTHFIGQRVIFVTIFNITLGANDVKICKAAKSYQNSPHTLKSQCKREITWPPGSVFLGGWVYLPQLRGALTLAFSAYSIFPLLCCSVSLYQLSLSLFLRDHAESLPADY